MVWPGYNINGISLEKWLMGRDVILTAADLVGEFAHIYNNLQQLQPPSKNGMEMADWQFDDPAVATIPTNLNEEINKIKHVFRKGFNVDSASPWWDVTGAPTVVYDQIIIDDSSPVNLGLAYTYIFSGYSYSFLNFTNVPRSPFIALFKNETDHPVLVTFFGSVASHNTELFIGPNTDCHVVLGLNYARLLKAPHADWDLDGQCDIAVGNIYSNIKPFRDFEIIRKNSETSTEEAIVSNGSYMIQAAFQWKADYALTATIDNSKVFSMSLTQADCRKFKALYLDIVFDFGVGTSITSLVPYVYNPGGTAPQYSHHEVVFTCKIGDVYVGWNTTVNSPFIPSTFIRGNKASLDAASIPTAAIPSSSSLPVVVVPFTAKTGQLDLSALLGVPLQKLGAMPYATTFSFSSIWFGLQYSPPSVELPGGTNAFRVGNAVELNLNNTSPVMVLKSTANAGDATMLFPSWEWEEGG